MCICKTSEMHEHGKTGCWPIICRIHNYLGGLLVKEQPNCWDLINDHNTFLYNQALDEQEW